jgi:hypothetical protein
VGEPNVYCVGCGHQWWLWSLGPLFRLFAQCPKCKTDGPLLLSVCNDNDELDGKGDS